MLAWAVELLVFPGSEVHIMLPRDSLEKGVCRILSKLFYFVGSFYFVVLPSLAGKPPSQDEGEGHGGKQELGRCQLMGLYTQPRSYFPPPSFHLFSFPSFLPSPTQTFIELLSVPALSKSLSVGWQRGTQ